MIVDSVLAIRRGLTGNGKLKTNGDLNGTNGSTESLVLPKQDTKDSSNGDAAQHEAATEVKRHLMPQSATSGN